ncbi:MAG: Glycosyl transferase group 1 [Parcubacteria group bacterium GW2011_GWA2_51_10]|nr:MAG: Glycosyl transferase group 1 [Parcubacteria group bacterium GW2011_GWA2_51_10]
MQESARVLIVFCGRFLNEKADSLFADESARAFAQLGREVIVLAPRRFGRREPKSAPYALVYLPTIDFIRVRLLASFANYLNLAVFSFMVLLWLLFKGHREDVVLSNEPIPLLFASLLMRNIVYEVHIIPKKKRWIYRTLLRRTRILLPITEWNAKIGEEYGFPKERVLLARSAVNIELFEELDKKASRERLGLPEDARIALYTGHLYAWKGVDTLAEAARLRPEIDCMFVGGTTDNIAAFKKKYSAIPNIRVVGYKPHEEIALWQAAADILVLPNSDREEISAHYTSPMKLYEYMASCRPILASDLPSIREIVSEKSAYFARADDPQSFANALVKILTDSDEAKSRAAVARSIAEGNTWTNRASKILAALSSAPVFDRSGTTHIM